MPKSRSVADYALLASKGLMMGAADAVPGVSGGTIAFITGIYEELIETLRRFDLEAAKLLLSGGVAAFWQHINGTFLATLLAGIVFSLVTLAHGVLFLLAEYPVLLWAFFFGLVLASTWSIARHIQHWDVSKSLLFSIGALSAYIITSLAPMPVQINPYNFFIAGMIAICAMILPGISGSFILLLMGMYAPVLTAVKNIQLLPLLLFMGGCVIGILAFSRVLNWLFHHYRQMTLALLAGFLLGSLNKIWPWKYTTAYILNSQGVMVPLAQENVSPFSYTALTGLPGYPLSALLLILLGVGLVLIMEKHSG